MTIYFFLFFIVSREKSVISLIFFTECNLIFLFGLLQTERKRWEMRKKQRGGVMYLACICGLNVFLYFRKILDHCLFKHFIYTVLFFLFLELQLHL